MPVAAPVRCDELPHGAELAVRYRHQVAGFHHPSIVQPFYPLLRSSAPWPPPPSPSGGPTWRSSPPSRSPQPVFSPPPTPPAPPTPSSPPMSARTAASLRSTT